MKLVKMPKDAIWLVPGLRVKRWFLLIIFGAILAFLGVVFLFKLSPVYFALDYIKAFIQYIPFELIGIIFIVFGALIFITGWKNTNFSMMDATDSREKGAIRETLYRRMKLDKGPKIVAIGGGTGLSTMLRGIKRITNNITAVVTVGDDGGSSGRLREEMSMIPPGDVRQCIAALADDDDIVAKLFQYRFKTGEGLEGHSFGNLFISAMTSICGDVVSAIKESSKVLLIRGRVLPATTADVRLIAEMEDGSIVKGESNIPEAGKKIVTLTCEPVDCKPNEEALIAIKEADIIILGPGSLYTSVIPNLLVKDITRAIDKSKAKKMYICNVMTQPGETDNYSASDHVRAIFKHAELNGATKDKNFFDTVLVNDSMPSNLAKKYEEKDSLPIDLDISELKKMGLEVVKHKLIMDNPEGLVRHSASKLARVIYYWYRKCKKNEK